MSGLGHPRDLAPLDRAALRLESWDASGDRRAHLLALEGDGIAIAHVLVRVPEGPALLVGSGLFTDAALTCDRDALLDRIELVPASRSALGTLGIYEPDAGPLASRLERVLVQLVTFGEPDTKRLWRLARHLAKSREDDMHGPLGHHASETILADGVADYWPGMPAPTPAPEGGPRARIPLPGRVRSGGWHRAEGHPDLPGLIEPWRRRVRETSLPGALESVGPHAWSSNAFAHHSAPGEIGRRRDQAARLQPAFAPTLVADPRLRTLVDEGLPFEAALLDAVRASLPQVGDGLTPGRLRRLRGYGETPAGERVVRHLAFLAAYPVERMPATERAWINFKEQGEMAVARLLPALEPRIALRGIPQDWDLSTVIPQPDADYPVRPAELMRREVRGMLDMGERCLDTLVRSCLPHAWARHREGMLLALGLLCEGRTLLGALALQRAWHADLARFERTLAQEDAMTWPALFAPFDAGGGIEIRCLTTTDELRAEGWHGPDADGAEGLGHCIGGYGPRCVTGELHVVSIGIPGGPGGRRRLSTASLSVRAGLVEVVEHSGLRNGRPPPEAEGGLARLREAIARRSVILDPTAAQRRPAPDNLRRSGDPDNAFAAWKPYLPKRFAEGGLESLVAAFPPVATVDRAA